MIDFKLHNSVSGRFQIQVFRNGKLHYDTGEQTNKILNSWFTTPSDRGRNQCTVGTGNQEPVGEDAGLRGTKVGPTQAAEATKLNTVVPISATSQAVDSRYQYVFPLGSVVGTISEVILHSQAGISVTYPVLIRALTKNNLGVPTSITLTAEDQLIIYHTLRTTCNDVTSTNNVVFEGTTYNLKHKFLATIACGIATNGWISMVAGGTGSLAGSSGFDRVYATDAADYVTGAFTASGGESYIGSATDGVGSLSGNTWTRTVQVTIPAVSLVRNNIKAFGFANTSGSTSYANVVHFSPAINKTNLMQFKFNFTLTVIRD